MGREPHLNRCNLFFFFNFFVDNAFHFPNKGITDAIKISNMRSSLTAFTVCLWMSSNNTRGTPFSYAVGEGNNDDNELLIEYNGSFEFLIGGTRG